MAEDANVETAKRAYEAYGRGDAEAAMQDIADDVEWIVPGQSAISGTYHGKQEVGQFWGRLARRTSRPPEYWFSDGERVVVLTHVTMEGGEADQADVLTYRDGKLVKFQNAGDTALFERVFGS